MNITFYCFNYYSLYVSYVYTIELKKKYFIECNLIWRNNIFELPEGAHKIWDTIIELNFKKYKKNYSIKIINKLINYFVLNIFTYKIATYNALKKTNFNYKNMSLLVFKDDNIYDIIMIDYMKKHGCKNVVLIEEGLRLYLHEKNEVSNYKGYIIKLIYSLTKVSKNIFSSQGENKKTDVILCKEPEKLPNYKKKDKKIAKQSNLFSKKYAISFLNDIFNYKFINKKIDIIYITQPLSEDGLTSKDNEINAMETILDKIDSSFKVGIKLHPRENRKKYQEIIKKYKNVSLIDNELQKLPAELMFFIYNQPKIITPFSSVVTNLKKADNNADIALIYKLYNFNEDYENELDNILSDFKEDIITKNTSEIKIKTKCIDNQDNNVNEELHEIKKIIDGICSK